jgi:glucan biosynthesis protein C
MPRNTKTGSQPDGAFALSAVWASTMLLGLVIHAAVTYGAVDYHPVWSLKDRQTHPIFDWVVRFIHCFRMPLFFLISGYFAAHLFREEGPRALLKSALVRLLLPFIVGVLILWPLSYSAFSYSRASIQHAPSGQLDGTDAWTTLLFLPFKTGHLWFLYFLIVQVALAFACALVLKKATALNALVHQISTGIFQRFWTRCFILATALFLCLYWMGKPFILTNHHWGINPAIFTTYFIYFGGGWLLHTSACVAHMRQYAIPQISAGLALFLLHGWISWPIEPWSLPVQQALVAAYSTCFVLGSISLALSHCTVPSPYIVYGIEASYWVYWVHLPLVAFVPGWWSDLPISVWVKFLFTLGFTAALCLLSHWVLVRGTAIGKILNGVPFNRNGWR